MLTAAILSGFVLAVLAPGIHRFARRRTGWMLAVLPAALTVYFASLAPGIAAGTPVRASVNWVPSLNVSLSFYIDGLALMFALLICGVGTLVVVYAGEYLKVHPQLGRFFSYILMFMAAMLGVVTADDVISLFVFWELTSLSSYFLIGFEHGNPKARWAALQALLVTGLGGLALLAGVLLLANAGGSTQLSVLLGEGDAVRAHWLYVPILLLVVLGAFTKSAQFPFHFWLPAAMEAPTPVSAYLHSATMVKAGVYLLARLAPVLGSTELWLYLLTGFGMVTMIVTAFLAVAHTDLKRILAYSTASVLGLLVMLIGVDSDQAIAAAVIYLVAHALYKGALFLVAGAVDHEAGTRDITDLGGLRHSMRITFAAGLASALSMAGVPAMGGFVAKEMFYESALHSGAWLGFIVAAVVASLLTVVVAMLVGVGPFFGPPTAAARKAHEPPLGMWLGPALLAVFGLFLGLAPGYAGRLLLSPTVNAIRGHSVDTDFAVWHGVNQVLVLSILTLIGGAGLYTQRRYFAGIAESLRSFPYGPNRWYDLAYAGLNWVASAQTRVFQNGYLRLYVLTCMLAVVVLGGHALVFRSYVAIPPTWRDVRLYEIVLAVIILLAAFTAVRSRTRFGAITALGAVGYSVAVLYVLYGAPDLAMTQFLVDTLIVILFVLVFHRLPRYGRVSPRGARLRDGIVCAATGALMGALSLTISTVPLDPLIPQYFAEHSVPGGHGRNIVNVILVDFRSLDTLGEITVLGVAAIGVYALLKLRAAKETQA